MDTPQEKDILVPQKPKEESGTRRIPNATSVDIPKQYGKKNHPPIPPEVVKEDSDDALIPAINKQGVGVHKDMYVESPSRPTVPLPNEKKIYISPQEGTGKLDQSENPLLSVEKPDPVAGDGLNNLNHKDPPGEERQSGSQEIHHRLLQADEQIQGLGTLPDNKTLNTSPEETGHKEMWQLTKEEYELRRQDGALPYLVAVSAAFNEGKFIPPENIFSLRKAHIVEEWTQMLKKELEESGGDIAPDRKTWIESWLKTFEEGNSPLPEAQESVVQENSAKVSASEPEEVAEINTQPTKKDSAKGSVEPVPGEEKKSPEEGASTEITHGPVRATERNEASNMLNIPTSQKALMGMYGYNDVITENTNETLLDAGDHPQLKPPISESIQAEQDSTSTQAPKKNVPEITPLNNTSVTPGAQQPDGENPQNDLSDNSNTRGSLIDEMRAQLTAEKMKETQPLSSSNGDDSGRNTPPTSLTEEVLKQAKSAPEQKEMIEHNQMSNGSVGESEVKKTTVAHPTDEAYQDLDIIEEKVVV